MPHMQRLTNDGIALHAGYITGKPASHGCVRLPAKFAAKLFNVTRIGTPVVIAA
jgi:lipoprotein-anchoring transpeptidase ErfK/SrfK